MSVHIRELTGALERAGNEVVVVAPSISESVGRGGEATAFVRRLVPGFASELLELAYDRLAFRRLEAAYLQHEPDVLYERYNLFLMAGRALHRKYGVPFLLEVNAPLAEERREHGGLAWRKLAFESERRVWKAADAVLAVSGPLADIVAAAGVMRERLHVIPNGIDTRAFHPRVDGGPVRRKLGLDDKLVLGFTGFMRPWHGLDRVVRFLAARKSRSDLHFLVIGEGPARPDIESLARELGVADRITTLGVVGRPAVAAHVAAFDIALQPMSVPYASPLKLFEYMALGRAILAPDQPNIREIVGSAACLFDAEANGAFERALETLCNDAALRARLGAAAAETLRKRDFTWDCNARRIGDIAADLIARRAAA